MEWQRKSLESVAEKVVVGYVGPSSDYFTDDGVPFLRTGNVGTGQLILSNMKRVAPEFHLKQEKSILKQGDVLVSRVVSDEVNAAVVPAELEGANCGNIIVIRPGKLLNSRFVMHLIATPSSQRQLLSRQVGSAQGVVNTAVLKDWEVPVPPLSEQRRIAAILDQAEDLRAKRRHALAILDTLAQSIFLEMFGDPVLNPKNWMTHQLGQVLRIRRGGSPRPIEQYLGGTVNWIKIGDATAGDDTYITSTRARITEDGLRKTVFLKAGSLVFANCGVSLGFARILKVDGCIHDGWLSLEEIPETVFDKVFLLKALNQTTAHFRRMAPEGTQPNLNTGIMKRFSMICPPLELQKTFVNRIEHISELKTMQAEQLQRADSLKGSLEGRAFRGEL